MMTAGTTFSAVYATNRTPGTTLHAGALDRVRYRPTRGSGLPMEDEAWSASFAFRAWDTSTGHATGTRGRWEDPEGVAIAGTDPDAALPPLPPAIGSGPVGGGGGGNPSFGRGAGAGYPDGWYEEMDMRDISLGGLDNSDGLFYGLDGELIAGLGERRFSLGGGLDGEGSMSGAAAAFDRAAALRAMGVDGNMPGVGEFYGLDDGLLEGLGSRDGGDGFGGGGGPGPPPAPNATWVHFNASSFTADGSISLAIGTAVVSVFGLERSGYIRDNYAKTLTEKARVKEAEECPPTHGSALQFDIVDSAASLVMEGFILGGGGFQPPEPPWTVEAWVRRDAWLSAQALTSVGPPYKPNPVEPIARNRPVSTLEPMECDLLVSTLEPMK
jgi:hypothetical protein